MVDDQIVSLQNMIDIWGPVSCTYAVEDPAHRAVTSTSQDTEIGNIVEKIQPVVTEKNNRSWLF